jgi:hypothetical protein
MITGAFKDRDYFDYHQTLFIRDCERHAERSSGMGQLLTGCVGDGGKSAVYRNPLNAM